MRTAGLRSISAKQLALSCQCVAMLAALHPLLRAGSLALVSQPRRALLIPEFDRLLTDLTLHTDEIHTKLVDIMSDRLAAATAALPTELQQVGEGLVEFCLFEGGCDLSDRQLKLQGESSTNLDRPPAAPSINAPPWLRNRQVSVNTGEPSPSVATLARQLMTLRSVLTPLLLKEVRLGPLLSRAIWSRVY